MTDKHYAHFLTVTQYYMLDVACASIYRAFPDSYGTYLVGSVLTRPNFRDVDVRTILGDAEFERLFPHDTAAKPGESNHWMLVNRSISELLSRMSGLPVDFQIQSMTDANQSQKNEGPRNAIGVRIPS